MRPDFSLIWGADNAPFTPIEASDYTAGWVFRTGAPPRRVNFDYFQNLSDQRTAWLAGVVDSVRIDVAGASTVNLTTAAPDTRGIRITGTTTINGFTAVAGATYFVTFSGALTLTNSASLVTQTGANILTAAGDTCIIRAISDNVVEILSYVPSGGWIKSHTTNGYQKLPSGLIIQWGQGANSVSGFQNITLPIAFPNAALMASVGGRVNEASPSDTTFTMVSLTNTTLRVYKTAGNSVGCTPTYFAVGY